MTITGEYGILFFLTWNECINIMTTFYDLHKNLSLQLRVHLNKCDQIFNKKPYTLEQYSFQMQICLIVYDPLVEIWSHLLKISFMETFILVLWPDISYVGGMRCINILDQIIYSVDIKRIAKLEVARQNCSVE